MELFSQNSTLTSLYFGSLTPLLLFLYLSPLAYIFQVLITGRRRAGTIWRLNSICATILCALFTWTVLFLLTHHSDRPLTLFFSSDFLPSHITHSAILRNLKRRNSARSAFIRTLILLFHHETSNQSNLSWKDLSYWLQFPREIRMMILEKLCVLWAAEVAFSARACKQMMMFLSVNWPNVQSKSSSTKWGFFVLISMSLNPWRSSKMSFSSVTASNFFRVLCRG